MKNLKQRRTRFIASLLSIVMIITMLPMPVMALDGHTHEGWTEIDRSNISSIWTKEGRPGYYIPSGNYVLTEDLVLNNYISIGDSETEENVNLCLNGHMITSGRSRDSREVFSFSNGVLNIYDCSDTVHYFVDKKKYEYDPNTDGGTWLPVDGKDGYFETYEPDYDPTEKEEGTDYICVTGGGIWGVEEAFYLGKGIGNATQQLNAYGITIIGCHADIGTAIVRDQDGHAEINLNGMTFRENVIPYDEEENYSPFNTSGLIALNGGKLNLTGCNIFRNSCTQMIQAMEKSTSNPIYSSMRIKDTTIRDNEVTFNYCIFAINTDITLAGDVLIKDNLKEASQKNIYSCFSDDGAISKDKPMNLDDLTSGNGNIGVSLSVPLKPTEESVIVNNVGNSGSSFFSDSVQYYPTVRDGNLVFGHRIYKQPTVENGYQFEVNKEGFSDIGYQWYSADLIRTKLTDENTGGLTPEAKLEYDRISDAWKPLLVGEGRVYGFTMPMDKDSKFSCDLDFDGTNPTDGFKMCVSNVEPTEEPTFETFETDGDYSYTAEAPGEYIWAGCFGNSNDPAQETLIIKNARVEKTNVDRTKSISGQNTNVFTSEASGVYACVATLSDATKGQYEIISDVIEISAPLVYKINLVDEEQIAVDKKEACEGDTVTITLSPKEGYEIKENTLKVLYNSTSECPLAAVSDNKYTFEMPGADVNIVAEFEKKHSHELVKVEGKKATETEAGWKDCYKCVTCEKLFEDKDGKILIDDIDKWKAEGGRGYIAKLTPTKWFLDIPKGKWYSDKENGPVAYVFKNKIMVGVGDGTRFDPEGTCTREMFVQILYNMEGKPDAGAKSLFKDVKKNKWYYDAINWAASNGVTKGISDTKFGVGQEVTREQITQFLMGYAKKSGYYTAKRGSLDIFADSVRISGWAKEAVSWAYANKIISGRTNDGKLLFDPKANATRAEVAKMIMNFKENVEK